MKKVTKIKKTRVLMLVLIVISIILLLVFGCSKKTKVMKCSLVDKHNTYTSNINYEIYYSGKNVKKIVLKQTIEAADDVILLGFKNMFEQIYNNQNNTTGGVSYKTNIDDGVLSIEIVTDLKKVDMEKYLDENPDLKDYVKKNKLKIKGLKEKYTKAGYTCE